MVLYGLESYLRFGVHRAPIDWIIYFILCLVDMRQDIIIYCNDNNTSILSNVWSVDYNIYCFLNLNIKKIFKYKVKIKYENFYFTFNMYHCQTYIFK
jgi:hypothetical protein